MTDTHKVLVYQVDTILKHENADKLEIIQINGEGGYHCVVRKGDYKVGDLIAYIQPDSIVDVTRPEFMFLDPKGDGKPERIKVKKLRGVISQGLIVRAPSGCDVGDDVADYFGVTHYQPPDKDTHTSFKQPKKLSWRKWLRQKFWQTVFWFRGKEFYVKGFDPENLPDLNAVHFPKYDIENFRNCKDVFKEGELVYITEKLHGCVHSNTILQTKDGLKTIENVVVGDEVKSFDTKKNTFSYDKVIDKIITPPSNSDNWLKITLNNDIELICTDNHPILTIDGYVLAKDLTYESDIIVDEMG